MHLAPVRPTVSPSTRTPLRAVLVAGVAVAALGVGAVLVPSGPGAVVTPGDPALRAGQVSAAAAGSLSSTLLTADTRQTVTDGLQQALDDQASTQGGLVSSTYGALQQVRPGLSESYIKAFLPGFLRALEPQWQAYKSGAGAPGADFGAFLASRPQEVTDSMLAVADDYAASGDRASVISIYQMARPSIAGNVTAALPAIGSTLEQNMS